jgi:LacI family transcriptional regulator
MMASGMADNVYREEPQRPPTMRDVAAVAGVSLKTVSRVVNGEVGVSSELTVRVEDAVGLLGYRPDLTASNLRRSDRKTATIGLLLEDVANPFSSLLHRAVEDVAGPRGTLVFAGSSDEDPRREAEVLRAFAVRRVDGLIVVPASYDHAGLLQERKLGRPIVFVDRRPAFRDADSVTADNRAGIAEAVGHLAARGHRRVAYLGDLASIWTAAERYLGYVEGMSAAGIGVDPRLVRQDVRGVDAAAAATRDLLATPDAPTAILTGQNLITIGAIRALQELGLQRQVAVVGFDDFLLADLLDPPVTVVAQDAATIGRTAAELLFARLDGDIRPAHHVVVPTGLVQRGSGEIPAL